MFILNRKGLSLPLRGFSITNICYLFVLNVYGFDFFGNLGIPCLVFPCRTLFCAWEKIMEICTSQTLEHLLEPIGKLRKLSVAITIILCE